MGKPGQGYAWSPAPEYIGRVEGTWGSETSQYPQEKKTICDSVSSGERKRMRLNRACVIVVRCCMFGVVGLRVLVLTDRRRVINSSCRRTVLNGRPETVVAR